MHHKRHTGTGQSFRTRTQELNQEWKESLGVPVVLQKRIPLILAVNAQGSQTGLPDQMLTRRMTCSFLLVHRE